MNHDLAAAIGRALEHVRAQDVGKATSIIQAALAGRSAPDIDDDASLDDAARSVRRRSHLRLIDPDAEIVDPETGLPPNPASTGDTKIGGGRRGLPTAARLRKPLGEVVRALKGLRSTPGMIQSLKRAPTPPPQIPDGAQFLTRSFSCAAGTRSYKLYIPVSADKNPRGLIVMLHGCTQNPDDFAVGTNMNAVAEAHGLLVAYPAQNVSENVSSCWNWFRPGDQMRSAGEPAIVAGITRAIATEFGVEPGQVFVAGLSAGGAMAAIMAETYPDLYAAAGIHSGLAYASANDVMSALAAMRGQSDHQPHPKRSAPEASAYAPRMIIFHGSADQTVHPSNAERIFGVALGSDLSHFSRERRMTGDGRGYTRSVVKTPDGTPAAEYWLLDGAGHAWSGGNPSGSYADPRGPDASAEMVRFFLNASK